jgi:hypothetical protein
MMNEAMKMYSIEIEGCDGDAFMHSETFECLVDAQKIARRLESEDTEIWRAVVIVTETGLEA